MPEILGMSTASLSTADIFDGCVESFEYIRMKFTYSYSRYQLKLDLSKTSLDRWGQAVNIHRDPRFRASSTDKDAGRGKELLEDIALLLQPPPNGPSRYEMDKVPENVGWFSDSDLMPVFRELHDSLKIKPRLTPQSQTLPREQAKRLTRFTWAISNVDDLDNLLAGVYKSVNLLVELFSAKERCDELARCEIERDSPISMSKLFVLYEAADRIDQCLFETIGPNVDRIVTLTKALLDNDVDAAKKSISSGADVNQPIPTKDYWTRGKGVAINPNIREVLPIFMAGPHSLVITETLLEAGADANATNESGDTVLLSAVKEDWLCEQRQDIVKVLLAHGAKADGTTLSIAIEKRQLSISQDLLAHGAEAAGSAFTAAVKSGEISIMRGLLAAGADVNQTRYSWRRFSELGEAANAGDLEATRLLLDCGANLNIDYDVPMNDTIWSHWERYGHSFLYETEEPELISKITPLVLATNREKANIVRLLLGRGANPDGSLPGESVTALRKPGRSLKIIPKPPIVVAAWKGNLGIIKLLLKHGANIDAASDGCTAVVAAFISRHFDVAIWLLSRGASDIGLFERWSWILDQDILGGDAEDTLGGGADSPVSLGRWESFQAHLFSISKNAVLWIASSLWLRKRLEEPSSDAAPRDRDDLKRRREKDFRLAVLEDRRVSKGKRRQRSIKDHNPPEEWWDPINTRYRREIDLWKIATKPAAPSTINTLLENIKTDAPLWEGVGAVLEWEVPDFIQVNKGCDANSSVGKELIITASLLPKEHSPGSASSARCFQARSWADLVKSHLSGDCSDVEDFLGNLLNFVRDHCEDIKAGTLCPSRHFPGKQLSIRATCQKDRVYLSSSREVSNDHFAELLYGMELLCKSLRPAKRRTCSNITSAEWKFERYELPISTDDAPGTSGDSRQKFAVGPIMKLSDKQLEVAQHNCWQNLFENSASSVVDIQGLRSEDSPGHNNLTEESSTGKGLEASFEVMVALTGVDLIHVVDNGIVFVGYQTMLVPIAVEGDSAQFHLFISLNGQINPDAMNLENHLKSLDVRQFADKRCFLGWCQFAQIRLGTTALPSKVEYSSGEDRGRSISLDGFSPTAQAGISAPLTITLGIQPQYKFTVHRFQVSIRDHYSALLRDTASELAIIYASNQKQGWLVPKLSLLMHMASLYSRTSIDAPKKLMVVQRHSDVEKLVVELKSRGEAPIFGPEDSFRLQHLLRQLNDNLLTARFHTKESHNRTLYGFELLDLIKPGGSQVCMKAIKVSHAAQSWIDIANSVSAVILCSEIGDVITAAPSNDHDCSGCNTPPPPPTNGAPTTSDRRGCNAPPLDLDFLTTTISCLTQLVVNQGGKLNSGCKLDSKCIKLSKKSVWNVTGNPFEPCSHTRGRENTCKEGTCREDKCREDTCWNREGKIQRLEEPSFLKRFLNPIEQSEVVLEPPPEGAVVFRGTRWLELFRGPPPLLCIEKGGGN